MRSHGLKLYQGFATTNEHSLNSQEYKENNDTFKLFQIHIRRTLRNVI